MGIQVDDDDGEAAEPSITEPVVVIVFVLFAAFATLYLFDFFGKDRAKKEASAESSEQVEEAAVEEAKHRKSYVSSDPDFIAGHYYADVDGQYTDPLQIARENQGDDPGWRDLTFTEYDDQDHIVGFKVLHKRGKFTFVPATGADVRAYNQALDEARASGAYFDDIAFDVDQGDVGESRPNWMLREQPRYVGKPKGFVGTPKDRQGKKVLPRGVVVRPKEKPISLPAVRQEPKSVEAKMPAERREPKSVEKEGSQKDEKPKAHRRNRRQRRRAQKESSGQTSVAAAPPKKVVREKPVVNAPAKPESSSGPVKPPRSVWRQMTHEQGICNSIARKEVANVQPHEEAVVGKPATAFYVPVCLNTSKGKAHGIPVSGGLMLNRHFYEIIKDEEVTVAIGRVGSHKVRLQGVMWQADDSDIVVVRVPGLPVKCVSKSKFATPKLDADVALVYNRDGIVSVNHSGVGDSVKCGNFHVLTYKCDTVDGDCGCPLIQGTCVVGIHSMGNAQKHLNGFAPVTKSLLEFFRAANSGRHGSAAGVTSQ
jgi:hypothetical protein